MAVRTTCCTVAAAAARRTGRCTSTDSTSKLPLLATAVRRLTGLAHSEIHARSYNIGVVPGCGITWRPSAVGVLLTGQAERTPRQVLSRRGYHALNNNNSPAVVMRSTSVCQSRLKHGGKKGVLFVMRKTVLWRTVLYRDLLSCDPVSGRQEQQQ